MRASGLMTLLFHRRIQHSLVKVGSMCEETSELVFLGQQKGKGIRALTFLTAFPSMFKASPDRTVFEGVSLVRYHTQSEKIV
jgi:hypothetical protein